MDWQWKAFVLTFVTVFLAELGDKTQLATVNFAAKGYPLLSVFVGSATALVVSAAIGTLVGVTASRFISQAVLSKATGLLFVMMGVLIFLRKI